MPPGGPVRSSGAPAGRGPGPANGAPIPDRLYFRIGDVAKICDLPAYVLRFWETEFPQLRPNKGGTGQRLYRRRDVEAALKIKQLLYDEGYTIPGARQLLKSEARQQTAPQMSLLAGEAPGPKKLTGMRRELEAILALLSRAPGAQRTAPTVRAQRRAPGLQPASAKAASTGIPTESLFDPPSGTLALPDAHD